MKINSKDQEVILSLLTQLYLEIVSIEQKFKLIAGRGDMRPRIDYFHDAVRAFAGEGANHPRLSIENLAYDLKCLNYIRQMPLSPFRDGTEGSSPSQEIITTDIALTTTGNRPDRKIRAQITELYGKYSVMFAALLKQAADYDYEEREQTIKNDTKDLYSIIHQFENKIDIDTITQLTHQLDETELRVIILTFLQHKKHKNKSDIEKLLKHLKNIIKQKDKNIEILEKSHHNFAMAQLSIFENSKDMLKDLALQGMNLIGKFVEASIAESKRQMGR